MKLSIRLFHKCRHLVKSWSHTKSSSQRLICCDHSNRFHQYPGCLFRPSFHTRVGGLFPKNGREQVCCIAATCDGMLQLLPVTMPLLSALLLHVGPVSTTIIISYTMILETHQCCFLSAPLRSNGADYVLLLYFIYFLFLIPPFVLRNYSTDSPQIFTNCVFWCSLNNPVVLKFFWCQKQQKFGQNFTGWLRFLTITSKR